MEEAGKAWGPGWPVPQQFGYGHIQGSLKLPILGGGIKHILGNFEGFAGLQCIGYAIGICFFFFCGRIILYQY